MERYLLRASTSPGMRLVFPILAITGAAGLALFDAILLASRTPSGRILKTR
jgi:hypothetical protein